MRFTELILMVLAISLALSCAAPFSRRGCVAPSPREQALIVRHIEKRLKVPAGMKLEISEMTPVDGGCHHRLKVRSVNSVRSLEAVFYLSSDGRFLSKELFDTRMDPIEEERRVERELAAALNQGPFASTGPSSALVTLTVFSDFQCSHCATLAKTLTRDVLPFERPGIRLVFRHFPLPYHDWAPAAAEACACAKEQHDEYFWKLHDYVFLNQNSFTLGNVKDRIDEYAFLISGLDRTRFVSCMTEGRGAAVMVADVNFGKSIGLTGTPTMFINGKRIQSTADPIEIRSLIRQFEER